MSNNSVYMLLHSYDYVFIGFTLFHFFIQQPFFYLFRNQVEIKLGIRVIDKSNII